MFFKNMKSNKVSALEMYSNMFYDMVTRGKKHNVEMLGADKIQIGYDRIFTGQCTKAYYYITSFPSEVNMSLFEHMRLFCDNEFVRINFNVNMSRHVIDWKSTQMKDNREVWNRNLEESAGSEQDFLGQQSDIKKAQREAWLIKSWRYVQKADMDNKALCSMDVLVEITTINNSLNCFNAFDAVCEKFEQYCAMYDISIKRVKNMLLDFLQYTSPVMDNTSSYSAGVIPSKVLVDEVVANLTPYTPGKLSETGALMGIDVRTNMMVYLSLENVMRNSLNLMVAAATSGGKSVAAKCLVREFNARLVNCIILDRDGEYKPLTNFCQGTIIDLNRASGKYFDSIQIGELTGYPEIDAGLYTDARVATTSVFNTLTNLTDGMTTTERKIYNVAYNNLLQTAGVLKDDSKTWKNAAKLRYHDLYYAIVDLSRNSEYLERYGADITNFVDKLSVYFEPDGLRAYLFQEKISINDILKSFKGNRAMILDICLYLDKDVDSTAEGKIEQSIKFITANYLSILLINHFHSLGMMSAMFVEEYQRYNDAGPMQTMVLNNVTGNRKRNCITVLITNSPQDIVKGDRAATMALTDNIKNLLLGKIENVNTIKAICETWNIPYCVETLKAISEKPFYDKCFMFRPENGEIAVVKQIMPPDLIKSPMFSTAVQKG